jgi:hypothetical protein
MRPILEEAINMTIEVTWIDRGREPQNPPDPAYPDGIHLDMTTRSTVKACTTMLPYPAKRCGIYHIECGTCGLRVAVTTAGRPDDPRSVKLSCRGH